MYLYKYIYFKSKSKKYYITVSGEQDLNLFFTKRSGEMFIYNSVISILFYIF